MVAPAVKLHPTEVKRFALNDRDRNGWEDAWEKKFPAFTKDKDADPDGDGISNWEEMLDGTDPSRPNKKGEVYVSPEELAKQAADAARALEKRIVDWNEHLAVIGGTIRPVMAPGELSTPEEKQKVVDEFASLRAKAAVSQLQSAAKERSLDELAQRMGTPKEIIKKDGRKLRLTGEAGGEPIYIGGNNYFAAAGVSADEVWSAAVFFGRDFTTNYNLTGNGQTLGMWEVDGGVRTSHQEFGSRVTQKDSAAVDGGGHATNVAGTMAGLGAFHLFGTGYEALTRGVAYQASVFANSIGNFKAERESQSAGNATDPPLFTSNDSWGTIAGWEWEDVDTTAGVNYQWVWRASTTAGVQEDWRLGTYTTHQADDTGSVDLDTFMAADAPRHLAIYACGNDRGNGPGSAPGSGTYYVPAFSGGYTTMSASSFPRDWADGDDGGYDSLDAPGTAKNVLTVGACEDVFRLVSGTYVSGYAAGANAVPASFTGFGPTDDGRIKPDLVAVGVGNVTYRTWLFGTAYNMLTPSFDGSAPSNNAYVSTAGTSIAAPGVTGGIGLMLQHRKNLYPAITNADAWRNSTLKAIAIETCDDVGAEGPDYQMGYGIFNVKRCCDLLSADKAQGRNTLIKEPSLAVGSSVSWIIYAPGGQTVSATATWSDPAGVAPASNVIDSTTPMLVNDINLKIEYLGSTSVVPDFPGASYPATTTYLPWTLNPDLVGKSATNRSAVATRGVDNRNNVERVSVSSAPAGVYRVMLTHAGGLAGNPTPSTQVVSLAMSGVTVRAGRITQTVKAPTTNDYTLTFEVDPDAYFTLQSSTDLITWSDVSAVHSSASGSVNTAVASAGGGDTKRFWRLKRG